MIQIPQRWEQWAKTLIGGAISGGANAALSALGATAANVAGLKVEQFTLRQLGEMFCSGAIIGAFMFLQKSPVPPDSTGNTQIIQKP